MLPSIFKTCIPSEAVEGLCIIHYTQCKSTIEFAAVEALHIILYLIFIHCRSVNLPTEGSNKTLQVPVAPLRFFPTITSMTPLSSVSDL